MKRPEGNTLKHNYRIGEFCQCSKCIERFDELIDAMVEPEPEPERPPQKVKVGEWFISKNNRLVKCKRVDWLKNRWVYYSDTNSFYWEEEISPIIHLQSEDEDRPFEVSDQVEWDEGNNVRYGMILELKNDRDDLHRVNVFQFSKHGAWWMDIARLRFAKRREK